MAKSKKAAQKPAKTTRSKAAPKDQGPTQLPGNAKGIGQMFDLINEARPEMNVTIETLGKKVTFVTSDHGNVLDLFRGAVKGM